MKTKKFYKNQRDHARAERDSALSQRDHLRRDNLALKKNDSLREQFIAALSHDLRNPIGSIKMAVDVLRSDISRKQYDAMIDLIDRNTDLAEELILRLLDAHLVNSGSQLPVNPERCEPISILNKCRDSFAPKSKGRIVLDAPQDLEVYGYWDAHLLERAFNNLLSNALKFSEGQEDVHINVQQTAHLTRVSFQNFGEVILPEDQLKIFDQHFQSRSKKTAVPKGWGLGLTLVKGIAESHGGSVEVSSNKEHGTIFTIKLPNNSTH